MRRIVRHVPELAMVCLLLAGCASAPRVPSATLDRLLGRLRCEHAALNNWDQAELARLAETCGPTVGDCERVLAEHEAQILAAKVALATGYQAVRLAAETRRPHEAVAATAAEQATRLAVGRAGVDLGACP